MARATFLIPIYFFSSIRAGVGKASIVANLAIFLNNLRQKVAIIDLDGDSPRKLKNSFPQSITLQEYADLCQIAHSEENRFQRNFYFTETSQISYFPAQKLSDPDLVFSDTSLRDFFIQLKASFDCILINYPPGAEYCQKISELLARQHLWRGSKPASLIVSMSDDKSLVALDRLLQHNPALSYQLQENTFLLFNKVPTSPEDVNLSESLLASVDLRKIFDFQQSYTITLNEEFSRQRLEAWPTVLKPDSLMHQVISGLHRLLTYSAESLLKQSDQANSGFMACLDGDLLEKLSPYLEKIHRACASRLFVHSSGVQVFLEEASGNFRIRVRISGISQPLLGIDTKIGLEPTCRTTQRPSPELFSHDRFKDEPALLLTGVKRTAGELNQRKVYKFPDCFSFHNEGRIFPEIPLYPKRNHCPSPIIFGHDNKLPEVPSLSHVLGYTTAGYRKFSFCSLDKYCEPGGVTHFFIPPEFSIDCNNEFIYLKSFSSLRKAPGQEIIEHNATPDLALQWPEMSLSDTFELPDEFARNKPFIAEHDFTAREPAEIPNDMTITDAIIPGFRSESQIFPVPYQYCSFSDEMHPVEGEIQQFELLNKTFRSSGFIIPLNMPERHLAKTAYDQKCFNFNLTPEDRKYREIIDSISMLKLQANHFFEVESGIGPFSDVLFHTIPQMHHWQNDLDNAVPDPVVTRVENFAISYAVKVPRSFVWEELLMDHSYPAPNQLNFIKDYSSDMGIFAVEPQFSLQTFFPQIFSHCTAEKAIIRITNLKTPFTQSIPFFADELRNMPFAKFPPVKKLSFDVFPVKFSGKNDSYKDHGNLTYYKVDNITDASIDARNFAPSKSRMLDIQSLRSEVSALNQKSVDKLPEVAIPDHYPVDPSFAPFNDSTPHLEKDACPTKFPADIFADYRPGLNIIRGKIGSFRHPRNLRSKVSFDFDSPILGIFSVRQEARKFFSFAPPEVIMNIIPSPMLVERQYEMPSPGIARYVYSVCIDPLQIPAKMPLRYRRLSLPTPADLAAEVFNLKIIGSLRKINWKKAKLNIDCNKISLLSCPDFFHYFRRNKRYPMTLKAKIPFRNLLQKKINFFIRPPEVIETIYQHLLYSSKAAFTSALTLKDKTVATKSPIPPGESFELNGHPADSPLLYDEQHLTLGKIILKKDRKFFPIVKPGFKDLMNLARQTNTKLNEIGQIIRS